MTELVLNTMYTRWNSPSPNKFYSITEEQMFESMKK